MIIDTSIWIDVFQAENSAAGLEVARLLREGQAASVGIVYAEVLRGARSNDEFEVLLNRLDSFTSFITGNKSTFTLAGQLLSELASRGEAIPITDAVIAAHALEGDHSLFTRDEHFGRVPGLKLHPLGGAT